LLPLKDRNSVAKNGAKGWWFYAQVFVTQPGLRVEPTLSHYKQTQAAQTQAACEIILFPAGF
jgi:hypothetical protein